MPLPNKLAFVDIETTGGSHTADRILEIGIIRVENLKITGTYQSLLDPQTHISPFISRLTGIVANDIESAPTFRQIKENIQDLLTDCVFVAHNAKFDYSFIKAEFERAGIKFKMPLLCTARLSRRIFPQHHRHNLDSLIERFRLTCTNRHRAYGDAEVLWQFYQMLIEQNAEQLDEAVTHLLHKPHIPPNIDQSIISDLPETSGVYVFYGSSELPIYIGKSKNIKHRVSSHLANQDQTSRQLRMCQQITRIETRPMAGELGALLLESQMVKQQQPIFNRQLRFASQLTVITKELNPTGYYQLTINPGVETDKLQPEKIVSVHRSQRHAKEFLETLVREHGLCQSLTGLNHHNGACFAYHLGWCKGACTGKELAIKYNLRLVEATSQFKIATWPFSSAILIEETNPMFDLNTSYVVDQWILKTVIGNQSEHFSSQSAFDLDTYKIIKQYLKKNPYSLKIKPLSPQQYQQILGDAHDNNHFSSFSGQRRQLSFV